MLIKIGIDGGDYNPGNVVGGGINREVSQFIKIFEALKISEYFIYYYYFSKKNSNNIDNRNKKIKYINLPSKFFASFFLPINIIKDKADVYLGFSGNIPNILSKSKMKRILFLHDFGFIKYPKLYGNSKKLLTQTKKAIKLADEIIFFSDYSKDEFYRLFPGIYNKKIKRIYPGLDHIAIKTNERLTIKKELINFRDYFLFVGVIKPMKNIEWLIEVFYNFLTKTNNNSTRLILIGLKEDDYYLKIKELAAYQKIKNRIIFLDNVSDRDLFFFYKNAHAVLNLAYDEGFCFPIFEALSLGKNTIVKDLPLYKEIAGDDPNISCCKTKAEIIEKMISIYKKEDKDINILKYGYDKVFTWQSFAESLLTEIKLLNF